MSEYSVGVVGCGGMGRAHAEAYEHAEGFSVAAAADMNERTRESFAEAFGVDATYEDHAAMLAAGDVDVVSVCTWHSTHAEIVIEAAEAGVEGVFCEKPMTTSMGEAEDVLDACERNDTKLTVGHQRRFDPVHEKARELVREGAIGEPRSIIGQHDAGLLNWGTHFVDLARFVLDDPGYEWVLGQVERKTDRHERGLPIEDRCLGHVAFENGVRFTYEGDSPAPELNGPSLQVTGSEGVIDIELGEHVTVTNEDGRETYEPEAPGWNRTRYLDAFAAWLDGEQGDHRCSGERAGAVMELMMAFYESARTRGVVEAPLETRTNPLELMIESGDLPVEHPGAYDIRLPYASIRGEE